MIRIPVPVDATPATTTGGLADVSWLDLTHMRRLQVFDVEHSGL